MPQSQSEPDLINGNWKSILDTLCIREWDAVIIGDGSGSGWGIGCGWSCTVTTRNLRRSPLLLGALNHGTVNVAELMAAYYGMLWFDSNGAEDMLKANGHTLKVHVISDSEITCRQGNHEARTKGPARTIWKAVSEFEKEGWQFKYHWYPREKIQLQILCDHASRQSRLALQELTLGKLIENDNFTIFDFNKMVS